MNDGRVISMPYSDWMAIEAERDRLEVEVVVLRNDKRELEKELMQLGGESDDT